MKIYRVYIEQVNQTYVEVRARTPEKAMEKAYLKWRREDAHAQISSVKEIFPDKVNPAPPQERRE